MYAKGLLGYLPANILQGVVGFGTLALFTRIMSPDDYGRYALAFGLSSLAQTACFTWIEAAMARYFVQENRDQTGAPALYGTLYRLFFVVSLAFFGLCAVGLWLWPGEGPLKLAVGMGLAAVAFRSLLKMVQEQRRAEGRVAQASIIDMAQTAGGFLIGLACIMGGLGGGSPVLASGLIALIILPFAAREDIGRAVRGAFDPERAKRYARYGLPVSASLILTLALFTADRFLIAHYLGEADAGAYHAGFSLASRILDVLFVWLGAAGGPALVHALENGGSEALKDAARQQFSTMTFLLFPATAGLIAVAPAFGDLMIGEALRERAIAIVPMITLGALLSGLTTYYFLQSFTLAHTTGKLGLAMAVPAVSNIALNLWLIPVFGLWGAAAASLISFALGLIAAWAMGTGPTALPVSASVLLRHGGASLVMFMVVSLIPAFGGLPELILKSVTGMVVYGGLALGFDLNGARGLSRQIISRARGRLAA